MGIVLLVLACVILYLMFRRFKTSTTEFVLLVAILLVALWSVAGNNTTEHFALNPVVMSMAELPTIVKDNIAGKMDDLIKKMKQSTEGEKDQMEPISKESFVDDKEIAPNGTVDIGRFARLKADYTLVDALLGEVKNKFPQVHARMFPTTA